VDVAATFAMGVTLLVCRLTTVMRSPFLEETSAGTSQEHEDAKQLLHQILKVRAIE
jgi:hypothetical protein